MRFLPGNQLSTLEQQEVLRAYVHRFTRDHKPEWAKKARPDGSAYPVQFASDADWLANTRFRVTKTGHLDRRVHRCESTSTWPDNPELRGKL